MVGSKLEQNIIGVFNNNPSAMYSINEIARRLGKSYPHINRKVNEFLDEQLLNKTLIGHATLCSLNLNNEKTILLLAHQEIERKLRAKKLDKTLDILDETVKNFSTQQPILTAFTNKKTLYLITQYKEDMQPFLKNIKTTYQPILLTPGECQKEFLQNETLFNNSCILYNYEYFYELIRGIDRELSLRAIKTLGQTEPARSQKESMQKKKTREKK